MKNKLTLKNILGALWIIAILGVIYYYVTIGKYPKIGTPFLKLVTNTRGSIAPQTVVAIA